MRMNFVRTGDELSCRVGVPPLPFVTAPDGNSFHLPLKGSAIAWPSPSQYCTSYTRAYGSAQAMRTAFMLVFSPNSMTTHCGCFESSSLVNACVRYGLLFQYDCKSPSSKREYPSNSVPSLRVNPRCLNE